MKKLYSVIFAAMFAAPAWALDLGLANAIGGVLNEVHNQVKANVESNKPITVGPATPAVPVANAQPFEMDMSDDKIVSGPVAAPKEPIPVTIAAVPPASSGETTSTPESKPVNIDGEKLAMKAAGEAVVYGIGRVVGKMFGF